MSFKNGGEPMEFHRIRRFLTGCTGVVHELAILALAVDGLWHLLRTLF
jgi:hypothetical protein